MPYKKIVKLKSHCVKDTGKLKSKKTTIEKAKKKIKLLKNKESKFL